MNLVFDATCSIDYDDGGTSEEDDLSDDEMSLQSQRNTNPHNSTLTQIMIITHLIGQRQYSLSRYGTKKFFNKVRQMQDLSQIEKTGDLNYGSRMGKGAEILCKLSALSQILKMCLEMLK